MLLLFRWSKLSSRRHGETLEHGAQRNVCVVTDSLAYQRMSWEALKKSINGLINKVNVSNIVMIIQELLQENIVRGR